MHSTGPWTAMVTDTMGDTPALWDIVQRSSGGTVAEIQSHNPDDAALVAAAPDLLAALNSMIDLAEFWINHRQERHMSEERYRVWLALGHESNAMIKARAAIARATGGQ